MHFKNVGYAQCLKIAKSFIINIDLKVADQYGVTQFHAAFMDGQIEVVTAKIDTLK